MPNRWLLYPNGSEPLDFYATQGEAESAASALALANRGTTFLIDRAEIDTVATFDTAEATVITAEIDLLGGLISAWRMEETGAADRVDQVSSYDLTAENAPSSGIGINNDGCVLVNASSEALTVTANNDINFDGGVQGQERMYCIWSKQTALGNDILLTHTRDPAGSSQFSIFTDFAGGLNSWVIDNSGSHQSNANIPGVIDLDWHFICFGYDPGDKKSRISIDGGGYVIGDKSLTNFPRVVVPTGLVMLGRRHSNSPLYIDATIDEVLLYDHILTTEERSLLWNAGVGRFHPTF
jgi:hypothetical protein